MLAHDYDGTVGPLTQAATEPLLAAIGPLRRIALLDVGCGPGRLVSVAVARGARVTGLDVSPAMLALAHERSQGACLVAGNARALPFANASFDALTCAFGFPGIGDPVGCLREAARVLRPGGTLAISLWLSASDGFDALHIASRAAWAHGAAFARVPTACCPLAERTLARRVLGEIGFGVPRFERSETVSVHRTAGEALAVLEHALPALAEGIERQPPSVRGAIWRAIRGDLERYRSNGRIVLRWPFVVMAVHRHAPYWSEGRQAPA